MLYPIHPQSQDTKIYIPKMICSRCKHELYFFTVSIITGEDVCMDCFDYEITYCLNHMKHHQADINIQWI